MLKRMVWTVVLRFRLISVGISGFNSSNKNSVRDRDQLVIDKPCLHGHCPGNINGIFFRVQCFVFCVECIIARLYLSN